MKYTLDTKLCDIEIDVRLSNSISKCLNYKHSDQIILKELLYINIDDLKAVKWNCGEKTIERFEELVKRIELDNKEHF